MTAEVSAADALVEVQAANDRLGAAMTERLAATAARDMAVVGAYAAGCGPSVIARTMGVAAPVVSRILTRALADVPTDETETEIEIEETR